MKKILFLILLFILLATVATGSPLDREGPEARSFRAGRPALHTGH